MSIKKIEITPSQKSKKNIKPLSHDTSNNELTLLSDHI